MDKLLKLELKVTEPVKDNVFKGDVEDVSENVSVLVALKSGVDECETEYEGGELE
jgi:hypothetical protein